MKLEEIRTACCEANKMLPATGLVDLTFGNVSVLDADAGVFAIKPSGVDYDQLTPESMVLVDLDRVRVYRHLSWQRKLKNLVQVEFSLRGQSRFAERLTFLRAYLGPVDRAELVRTAREIFAARRLKKRG